MDRISAAVRRQKIAEAAYLRAERRGFSNGDPLSDWLEAEEEIDSRLGKDKGASSELEQRLSATNESLKDFRKKLADLKGETRGACEADIRKLAALRDRLRRQIREMRAQTGQAAEKLKPQAENIWNDMAAVIERVKRRQAGPS